MPNYLIFSGTNNGGGNLEVTSSSNVSSVLSLLTKIFVHCKDSKNSVVWQLLLQVLLMLHLLLQFWMKVFATV